MVWRTNRWLAALSLLVCWIQIQQRHVGNASQETCERVHDQACLASNKQKWIPEAEHRCNIVRMTHSQLFDAFGPLGVPKRHPQPLIVLQSDDPTRNQRLSTLTSRENITSSLPPNLQVTLSSSNSFSQHRRTISLLQYLNEIANANNNTGETSLDAKSNETWYLFGETYTTEWKDLLTNYTLPPCETCVDELVALSFGIGNRGSGVQWHVHGPGFSEALHGRKHWVLYPNKPPSLDVNQTSRYWMEHVYTSLSSSTGEEDELLPHECTLNPGDLIYFPNQWYHATINLDPYTAFVSTFTTEHL